MPELPEVNTFQLYFRKYALKKTIKKVVVSDDKIIRNMNGKRFIKRLQGRIFVDTYRRGKFLFGQLDNGNHVLFHFGMTGDFVSYKKEKDIPRHERFRFEFDNGKRIGFNCPRKFARILVIDDLEEYLHETKLGEDALMISKENFVEKAQGRKVSIKGFLLNQKILAGVGNLYADAILYNTRIHPSSITGVLNKKQLYKIHREMQEMLQAAIDQYAKYASDNSQSFWEWRVEGNKPHKNAGLVKIIQVAGRTTYFCQDWQKLYS